jgi:hypothetical protein
VLFDKIPVVFSHGWPGVAAGTPSLCSAAIVVVMVVVIEVVEGESPVANREVLTGKFRVVFSLGFRDITAGRHRSDSKYWGGG